MAPMTTIPTSHTPVLMTKVLKERASKMYSVAHVVKTQPSHRSAATLMPRRAVCGPVSWVTQEIAVAITAAAMSAVPYCNDGLTPEAISHSRVRPMLQAKPA